jgi:hypothetical protein
VNKEGILLAATLINEITSGLHSVSLKKHGGYSRSHALKVKLDKSIE